MSPLVPLLSSVGLGAIAQISLRHGAVVRKENGSSGLSPWTVLWGICFAVATVLWLVALRQTDISYAFPMMGAGYVLVTLLACWLLHERISILRWVAVLIITAGVVMVGANR